MKIEEILSIPPTILSQQQRESYFENGYLLVSNAIKKNMLESLRNTTRQLIEETRSLKESNAKWDLDPQHKPETPRLRRLSSPNDHHPIFWEFASTPPITDIVVDLLGPNIKFHHSKLNFKWADGGDRVKWHQDIQFYPHTNYNVLAIGVYLYDCNDDQGPLGVISGSHTGQLFNQYDKDGNWTGCLSDDDVKTLDFSKEVYLPGKAGSITIHNCRTVHSSKPNQSPVSRPLLLNSYSSADAIPYTADSLNSRYYQHLVRGHPVKWAEHDPRPCLMPPDWSSGYTSIFKHQDKN